TPRPNERDQRLPIQIVAALAKSLRQLARSLATAFQGNAAACTNHDPLLVSPRAAARGLWAKCESCTSGQCDPPRRSCGAGGASACPFCGYSNASCRPARASASHSRKCGSASPTPCVFSSSAWQPTPSPRMSVAIPGGSSQKTTPLGFDPEGSGYCSKVSN